jgi:hypothetical protein
MTNALANTNLTDVSDLVEVPPTLGVIEEMTRAEIDTQVATAKRYPRSIGNAIQQATTIACMSQEVAASCIYSVPRAGKSITGPSIRLAEIMASCWGNMRYGSRVVSDDGKMLTVQGFAFDLEKNAACTFEKKVRITNKNGQRYSDDMVATASDAGQSKALRNAVFRIVPKVIVDMVLAKAKEVAVGKDKPTSVRREESVGYFGKLGVTKERLLAALDRESVEDMDTEDLLYLQTLAKQIKTGETKIDDAFPEARTESVANRITATAEINPAPEGLFGNRGAMQDTTSIKG